MTLVANAAARRRGWVQRTCVASAALALSLPLAALELRLIGEQRLPAELAGSTARVGGLSGLDYDAARDEFVAISDDKGEHGPARAYVLRLECDAERFTAARVTGVVALAAPPVERAPLDGEALRLDPRDGTLWFTSEGDARTGTPPCVRHASRDGAWRGDLPLPPELRFDPHGEKGVRPNLAMEGLAFAADGASLWFALEAPLREEGPVPTPQAGACTRFYQVDRAGRVLRRLAYPLDAIPVAPAPGRMADNGVSEILALAPDELLVLERAGVQDERGVFRYHVRVYLVPLPPRSDVTPLRKTLLLDCDRLPLAHIDNLEGMALGRRLPNGHRTLMLVSDDNFSRDQFTQLLAFEILP